MLPDTDILIAGAGPSGLMMACQLIRQNVHFRIIDSGKGVSAYSGALIIHAASLEIFKKLGIDQKILKSGRTIQALNFAFNGKRIVRIDISRYGETFSEFPFAIILEQNKTMEILTGFLENHGCIIEREKTLTAFNQNSGFAECKILSSSLGEETVNAKYVVGADGAHSFVRSGLGIELPGKTHPRELFIMDCKASVDLSPDEVLFSFSKNASAGIFPISGGWRVDGSFQYILKGMEGMTDKLRKEIGNKNVLGVHIQQIDWLSNFRSHQKTATVFRKGRFFLIGDAAHLFSPVGAQGMNHGFYDAFNLSWKLAFVIKNQAQATILDTYEAERRPATIKTAAVSNLLFDFLSTRRFLLKGIRLRLFPIVLRLMKSAFNNHRIKGYLFRRISGIGITYSKGRSLNRNSSPMEGSRFPFVLININGTLQNLQDLLSGTTFHLLIFQYSGSHAHAMQSAALSYQRNVSVKVFRYDNNTREIYRLFAIQQDCFFLIRPDLYIACSGYTTRMLTDYFKDNLIEDGNENKQLSIPT
jgi:2-polyprenyl-6-methoxyphenol hydroxylase-like FAD-dependent oxidoreductase